MFKNVAGKFNLIAYDATTGLEKTGDAANITAYVTIDNGTTTILADTSATEKSSTLAKGVYEFDAAQGETNGDKLMVTGKSTTANVVVLGWPSVIYTRPATGWLAPATAGRTLVVDAAGLADANIVKLLGTAWLTPGTAGTPDVKLSTAAYNAAADALIGRNVAGGSSTGRTVGQALAPSRNKVEISGGVITVYATDDTTPLWDGTVTTAAGNPISSIDPS